VTAGDRPGRGPAIARTPVKKPDAASGYNNFGLALQRQGRLEEAVANFRKAVALRPAYVLGLTNLGAALAALGHHQEAVDACDAALATDPSHAAALHNAGAALAALGRNGEAAERFGAALAVDPALTDARLGLVHALRDTGRLSEATDACRALLGLAPDNIDARLQLAQLLHRLDHHGEALEQRRNILDRAPNLAAAWAGSGRVLQEIGRMPEARVAFRRAVAAEPSNFLHYLNLANSTRLTADDPALSAMLDLAGDIEALAETDQINARFALAKALADIGRHDEAFSHLLAGNALRRRNLHYDERKILGGLQRIKDTFTPEHLARWPTGGESQTPIFIVGMPRSGSTLVEQILAAHPEVACAGESFALHDALKAHGPDPDGRVFPHPAFVPSIDQAIEIAGSYLRLVAENAVPPPDERTATRVTNKMLGNFRHLGLISRLFPRARIIHTFRDPIECCLSAFRVNFDSQPFAFDLRELGRHYRAYAILMRHWKRTLPPGTIFDVRYEAVAADFEASARAIVAHCGLAWNDACLRFHEARRPVKTASVEQVRRPIYRTSVRGWRPDAQALLPLLDGLGLPHAA
jgi:tetratricopeptide (TPR) repeat protein